MMILITSCKSPKTNHQNVNPVLNDTISKVEKEIYFNKVLQKKDSITSNENLEELYFRDKKNDTTFSVEGGEFLTSKEKIIFFSKIFYDNAKLKNHKYYRLLINKLGNIDLFIIEHNKRDKEGKQKSIVNDSIFLKNNKIFFWKNKEVTKKQLLEKEKEISIIKKQIDSILQL